MKTLSRHRPGDCLYWRSMVRSFHHLAAQVRSMPNKCMRILIADEHPSQRLQLEKMLNALGYYRIAPVDNFDDLQRLVQCALQPFNLLIGNIDLASHAGVDLARFLPGQHADSARLAVSLATSESTGGRAERAQGGEHQPAQGAR